MTANNGLSRLSGLMARIEKIDTFKSTIPEAVELLLSHSIKFGLRDQKGIENSEKPSEGDGVVVPGSSVTLDKAKVCEPHSRKGEEP